MGWSKLIDMAMDASDAADWGFPSGAEDHAPVYPPGLRIALTESELAKLGLDDDVDIGDMIDLRCFATVTSVSKATRNDGTGSTRIELQIEKVAAEDELEEDD